MRAAVALLVVLGIAGCAEEAADPQSVAVAADGDETSSETSDEAPADAGDVEPAPAPVEDTGPKSLHFEDTFQLTVSHLNLQGQGRFNLDPNCVSFGKDQVWLILGGTMQATWSAGSPLAEKMTLDVRDIALMATNNGTTSPSVLEFGRFQTVPNALTGLLFTVQPTDLGAVYGQQVTLDIAFDYFGKTPLETNVVPCVYNTQFEEE